MNAQLCLRKTFVSLLFLALVASNFYALKASQPGRTEILARLKAKVAKGEPLVAHIFVPLCDNVNQGIVPVNASLGNGQNLKTNLYWGAGYGIKTHFSRQSEWKLLGSQLNPVTYILERVAFERTYPNGAKVILLAEAYDGANMQECLQDFADAAAGKKKGKACLGGKEFEAWAAADLLAFNGHNGLMEKELLSAKRASGEGQDVVAIACFAQSYFEPHFEDAACHPLVTSTHLLAPEAYVMRAIIDSWAMLKSGEEVRMAAAQAYNTYQKCGMKGANRLFATGWMP